MKVMIVCNLVLLIFFVTFSKCHDYQQQQNHNYGPGQNIKSYGGYFPDTARYNEAANNFVNTQNHYRPQTVPYQTYGWNFNQPTRTYGGVNVVNRNLDSNQNPQNAPDNRIGWVNNNNYPGLNPNPLFPTMPLLFPNYFPQFPFPTFPNMYPFQNNFPQPYPNYPAGPHMNTNNQGNGYPQHNQGNEYVPPNQGNGYVPPNQGNGYVPPNQGQLPYPPSNSNQGGFPTINTNNEENKPNLGHVPQTNIHQGIPEGNINRSPDPINTKPNTVQTTLRPITTTEVIEDKTIRHTTIKPTRITITNSLVDEDENDEGVDYQFPKSPDFTMPNENNSSDVDIRGTGVKTTNVNNTRFSGSNLDKDKDKGFASNNLFENNDQRQWTNDDELKWLATTKVPYFDNKVPGLDCILPAAAVLGAKNAFKVSTLLPLDVPQGKHLLSCNATDLLQSRIKLDGMIYDCNNGDITLSCLTHGGLIDECEGQTLQCDNDNYNFEKVWCSNGTLISSSDIECRNALVEPHKSTLNCFYKHTRTSSIQTTTQPTVINVLPLEPLTTPDSTDVFETDNRNEDDFEYGDIDQDSDTPEDLMPQVKNAMKNVFPHDLLTMPSTGYLPPKSSIQPLNPSLRNHINTVFNTDMLASSRTENDNQVPSQGVPSRNNNDFSNKRDQMISNCNTNTKSRCNNDGVKGTPTSTTNRFGGDRNQNFHDRLIFTN
ncbi:putative uncharacterized protein DDB_G0282133 [Chironomus tepperi]|uniref:putative uncharacterized protein DDB_G0282133 n=1 Tax=Chironomus tepperi TaxID=113505 RepID=UPI00391FA7B7